jgi:phosphopantetheinyl transferase (holo-ACP synthase)
MRAEGPLTAVGAEPGLLAAVETEVNVGIDAESPLRFASGMSAIARRALFAEEEHDHCASFEDAPQRYAGTWCAKEAAVKALSRWVRLEPRRVVVKRAGDGRPYLGISGWNADEAGVSTRVTISSHGRLAIAWVVAWGPRPGSDSKAIG